MYSPPLHGLLLESYSEPCQTSKTVCLAEIANGLAVNYFAKYSILDVWQVSKYVCLFFAFLNINFYFNIT